jgi:hypothetical protein
MEQCHRRQVSSTSAGNSFSQSQPLSPSRNVVASTRPAGTFTVTSAAYEVLGRRQRI